MATLQQSLVQYQHPWRPTAAQPLASYLQIAKAQGAHVTTTCSGRNVEFVTRQLGADVAIDYTQVGLEAARGPGAMPLLKCWLHRTPPAHPPTCPLRISSRSHNLATLPQGPWEASPGATAAPFDHIVDTIGGSYERASLRLLSKGGSFANLGASGPGVERVSVWGIAGMLLAAFWRWAVGAVRLGPRYKL